MSPASRGGMAPACHLGAAGARLLIESRGSRPALMCKLRWSTDRSRARGRGPGTQCVENGRDLPTALRICALCSVGCCVAFSPAFRASSQVDYCAGAALRRGRRRRAAQCKDCCVVFAPACVSAQFGWRIAWAHRFGLVALCSGGLARPWHQLGPWWRGVRFRSPPCRWRRGEVRRLVRPAAARICPHGAGSRAVRASTPNCDVLPSALLVQASNSGCLRPW